MYNEKLLNIDANSKLHFLKSIKISDDGVLFEVCRFCKYKICKFRISDHCLAIEIGRYKNYT